MINWFDLDVFFYLAYLPMVNLCCGNIEGKKE